jgi:hypothetical protein
MRSKGFAHKRVRLGSAVLVSVCAVGITGFGAFAAAPDKVTVTTEGAAPFQHDLSLDEVRARARDEARRNAIEQAVGVFVRATTVVHNSQIAEELITAVARGVIEEERWLDERIEEVKTTPASGPPAAVYRSRLKAVIRPVRVEHRAGFEVRASLNKQVFQHGEEARIRVRTTEPAYVHVFSVTGDGSVSMLVPNRFMAKNLVSTNEELVFPSEAMKTLGVRLRVMLPKQAKKSTEYIKVIATKRPVQLVTEGPAEGTFRTFAGTEGAMIQDVVKRLALLEDEEWAETTLPYEVRQ